MRGLKGVRVILTALAGVMVTGGTLLAQAPLVEAKPEAPKTDDAKVAAVVNGQTITMGEIETIIQMRGPLPVTLPAARRRQLQFEVMGMLIDNILMEQFLRENGPRIDEAEIAKRLADLEKAVKKANKTMEDYYKDTRQTEKQLRQALGQLIQWETYAGGRLNDLDIKHFYDENKDFFDGVTVRASHILIRVPPTASEAERQEARQKLLRIRQLIVSGTMKFADAAKEYSQCPSAKEGGDIGFFPRKMVVEENFAKAAFALPVGQVSDVISTLYGLHIIKVTERKPGEKASEFDKIKDVVRDFCIEELRQAVLAQQHRAAKIEIALKQPEQAVPQSK